MLNKRMIFRTLAFAGDHAGPALKAALIEAAKGWGASCLDLGTDSTERVDYPDYAVKIAEALKAGKAEAGILICGTGIGVSITANRFAHIRAALCHDVTTARLARAHNDANVLALGARVIGTATAIDCLDVFLTTAFEGGRHQDRLAKMDRICGTSAAK